MSEWDRSEPPPWYRDALQWTPIGDTWQIWYPIKKEGAREELVTFLWAWHDQIMEAQAHPEKPFHGPKIITSVDPEIPF